MFILAFSMLSGIACDVENPNYFYGVDSSSVEFEIYSLNEGLHPHSDVLDNPSNIFASVYDQDLRWEVESHGSPESKFYLWATMLAKEPIGENQFYTASALEQLYRLQNVDRDMAPTVWQMTIDRYQAVLDHFPGSVSYTESQTAFLLAPLAYDAIVGLGGEVENGWVKLVDEDGTPHLIQRNQDSVEEP